MAQLFRQQNFGFNIGAIFALGNKFQRIGYTLQTYYYSNFIQVNAEVRAYYNLKNLGSQKEYGEIVSSLGLVLGYGQKQTWHNPFLSPVSNQTKYQNSIGYSFNAYFNKVKTTQQTGTLAFQFGSFSVIADNDLLAKRILDRFRTGAFLLQYQYQDYFQAGLNCTMWTGQMGHAIRDDKDFPFIGYMDTTGGLYTNYSHGLLSAQFKGNIGLGQNLQANVGVDAQQVRNFMQNRLIHDMAFLPKKWFKRINCHIPMLDSADNQYLFRKEQRIKEPEFYWNVFSGASLFY